jgi:hypothetical protein
MSTLIISNKLNPYFNVITAENGFQALVAVKLIA